MFSLFSTFKNIPELWKKIGFTLLMLAIYRIGFYIALPIVDQSQLSALQARNDSLGQVLNTVAMFGGADVGMSTIFGLGIMPYISASIIFQLLGSVVPALEQLMKEGESGRKKINEYTRYATVLICVIQSAMWVKYLMSTSLVPPEYHGFGYLVASVTIMTAGTVFLMWIGEQIDEYGIGNGISMLIMAGILARLPTALAKLANDATLKLSPEAGQYGPITIVLLIALFILVILGVIAMTESQRRIPTQSAKHVRGRRVYGGAKQYLPLKVNQAGVMPIIFASSLLMLPSILFNVLRQATLDWQADTASGWQRGIAFAFEGLWEAFQRQGYWYTIFYILLIYFFCYFWTAITFNPKDMSENLQNYGSFIPGYRPGKRTADYLEKVMMRITFVGAAFLCLVAIIPSLVNQALDVDYVVTSFLGGTGLLIVVSVCLDLVQKIDSHLVMRNYPSLLNRK